MNVSLNIENDAELRAYIKDCIKGQVLAVIRDEFRLIVKEELERKIKSTSQLSLDRMMGEAFKQAVSSILYKEHNITTWNNDFVKPIVEHQVNNAIRNKNWELLVDTLAKEKVKALIG